MILRNMGTSHSKEYDDICKIIWEWCVQHKIWLTTNHIPGKLNVNADRASRTRNPTSAEWMLNPNLLKQCFEKLDFQPNIDLFASRINSQIDCYISYQPDPFATAVDAFSVNWGSLKFYAFPPFSLVAKVLSKIRKDRAEGICVLPDWPTQPWYPVAKSMMKTAPIILKPKKDLLQQPNNPKMQHPLQSKLQLLVCLFSAKG